MQVASGKHEVLVRDRPTRVFHWVLVLCVAGSWATCYADIAWFQVGGETG